MGYSKTATATGIGCSASTPLRMLPGPIIDYDDVELEKRALSARMLAETLKDSRRHEPTIDLSQVTLTYAALSPSVLLCWRGLRPR
jgi:hypothetical protein